MELNQTTSKMVLSNRRAQAALVPTAENTQKMSTKANIHINNYTQPFVKLDNTPPVIAEIGINKFI
jgi:hypothetical protein